VAVVGRFADAALPDVVLAARAAFAGRAALAGRADFVVRAPLAERFEDGRAAFAAFAALRVCFDCGFDFELDFDFDFDFVVGGIG
jgi:hypothetical protein